MVQARSAWWPSIVRAFEVQAPYKNCCIAVCEVCEYTTQGNKQVLGINIFYNFNYLTRFVVVYKLVNVVLKMR